MSGKDIIELDGSHGEGGGQILRTALVLSMLTLRPFRIERIREHRPVPGLRAQHLTAVEALTLLSASKVTGAEIGSRVLTFQPAPITLLRGEVDIGTAGALTLLFQSLIPPLLFGGGEAELTVMGGTDVKWSPSIDYYIAVILPHLRVLAGLNVELKRRGYFPKGGGELLLRVAPRLRLSDFPDFDRFREALRKAARPIEISGRGELALIRGVSHSSTRLRGASVAERQRKGALSLLELFGVPLEIETVYDDTLSPGCGITLWASFDSPPGEGGGGEGAEGARIVLGADALGERGKKAELVGREAAKELSDLIEGGSACDVHLSDNLVPLLALLGGRIRTERITPHTLSNIYVTEKFLGKSFTVDEAGGTISSG